MSGFFRNIDPPPPHRPANVYPPPFVRREDQDTLAGWRGCGGSIVRKTPDIGLASYSIIPLRSTPSNVNYMFEGKYCTYTVLNDISVAVS